MSWFPTFEAQTVVSITIGAIISIATYWLGQRRVKSAEEERISALNTQLVSAVIRRVAVDRQVMPSEHYEYVRSAKAQEAGLNRNLLINFTQAKARVFSAVIENDFLDVPSKNAVIELLDSSISEEGSVAVAGNEEQTRSIYLYRANSLLVLISLAVGLTASLVASSETLLKIVPVSSQAESGSSGWVEILLLGVVAIFVGVRLYTVLGPRHKLQETSHDESKVDQ